MFPNRLAFAALGIACVGAAAGGSYLATRHNVADVASPPAQAASATVPAPAAQPVQETEAVVGDTTKPLTAAAPPAEPAAAPAPKRADASRADAAPRAARPARPASTTARQNAPEPPALERSWPSSTQSPASTRPASSADATQRADEEPVRAPEPPAKTFEELVVTSGSVIGLQNQTPISTERARVEDRVEAKVTRDVRVGGEVAIPAGTRAVGTVVVVERGGKFKERARLGIRFHTLTLADGTRLPISTETIYREGDAPGNGSAAKVGGGAVAGAILGAIIGGGKGAAIGATTGAGAGTAAVMAGDRSEATLPVGTEVTARIVAPVTVTVEK